MKKSKKIRICIIIPAYNENRVIADVISKTNKVFSQSRYGYEIVVIDDKSTDDTAVLAKEAGATTIKHIINQGAGGATSTGLRYAKNKKYTIAATMDADGQHDPYDTLKCIEAALEDDVDLLIGSRLIDSTGMSRVKVLGNKGLTLITRLLFRVNVTDSQSGLRVFSSKALNTLEWKSISYDFCSEMLWRAKQADLHISEHPIKAIYTDYSKQKGQNNWNSLNIIKSLVRRRIVEMFE